MRFLLGAVPFGCDNIGDETILAGVINILRRNFKDPEITVLTAKPDETSKLLNVNALGLYGFRKEYPLSQLQPKLKNFDVFIWAGATGLSDYPQTALSILSLARRNGLKTVLWGVGMDSTLNPAFFKLAGKKLKICKLAKMLSLGIVDFPKIVENRFVKRMKKALANELHYCALNVVRDPQTKAILSDADKTLDIVVGADSAIIFDNPKLDELSDLKDDVKSAIFNPEFEKIGLCISAQRQVADLKNLALALDKLLKNQNRRMFFIPMNPLTDSVLMEKISELMEFKDRTFMVKNCKSPIQVISIASLMNVVISSRLHLLILSANVSTGIVGISRGSKVDNFINQFGLKSAGDVYDCNYDLLCKQTESLLKNPYPYKQKRDEVYKTLSKRLKCAEELLQKSLK